MWSIKAALVLISTIDFRPDLSSHRANPFHNFEHASHVTMSVVKLLSRIVAPNLTTKEIDTNGNIASTLHDHTYGITSDPLTQFAVVLSALIHDGTLCKALYVAVATHAITLLLLTRLPVRCTPSSRPLGSTKCSTSEREL
jgi:hypothetical protein